VDRPQPSDPFLGGCGAQLEALGFTEGARVWLDYALAGHVDLGLAVEAAQKLLRRADRWWQAAA
jgi:hypothetical protein